MTSDCLFPGGPGRTTCVTEFQSLMDDLESRVFGVYGDDTTLGEERPRLGEWRERGW